MKYTTYLAALAILSLTLVGCKPANEKTSTELTEEKIARTEAAIDDAKHDWDAYTYAQRSQFIASMEAELAAINRSIDELAILIDKSGAEAKAEATPRLNELRREADVLETNIEEAKSATASTWDSVKATTRKSYDSLKESFNDARQWMSDQMEP